MSSSTVYLVLYYGGELSVSDDFFPTYTGGENRHILISRRANFNSVQDRIMRSLNVDSTRFRINLICKFPVGASFIATPLADDEVCESVINAATAHPIVVYVEIEIKQIIDTEAHDYAADEFQTIETSQHHLPPRGPHHSSEDVDISAPPIRATHIASTSVNMDEYHFDEVALPEIDDEGYETMPSVTSSDTDDSEGEICEENYPNAATSQILRDYSNKTATFEEHMFSNNEYIQACQWYRDADEASSSYAATQSSQPHATGFDAGPSSMPDVGPYTYPYSTPAPYFSQEGMFSPFQSWQAAGSSMYPHPSVYMPQMHPVYPIVPFQPGPSQEISDVTPLDDTEQTTDQAEDDERHQQHHLRDCPRRPPAHYTPGSDALPPRRHRRH